MKLCPFCIEPIQDAAVVCKHCKRDLPPPRVPHAQKRSRTSLLILVFLGILILASFAVQLLRGPSPNGARDACQQAYAERASPEEARLFTDAQSAEVAKDRYVVKKLVSGVPERWVTCRAEWTTNGWRVADLQVTNSQFPY